MIVQIHPLLWVFWPWPRQTYDRFGPDDGFMWLCFTFKRIER